MGFIFSFFENIQTYVQYICPVFPVPVENVCGRYGRREISEYGTDKQAETEGEGIHYIVQAVFE